MVSQVIEYVQLSELTPYEKNARMHSRAQVKQIAASIREFGFTNPILTDGKGGILAGHGRYAAALLLRMDSVPCLSLGHLSAAQQRAYVLADNQLALNAGYDFDVLAFELDALNDEGFNIDLLGFTPDELNDLIGTPDPGSDKPKKKKPDVCPECGCKL